ncbi:MAG: beta-galactosidase [Flavobacteriales bacterium]|jgi:beta-galactosidase
MTHNFDKDFTWGVASSAYQIEGGAQEGGRGPSIWDAFDHIPGKILNGDNASVACDHFNRWQEDIDLMVDMNIDAYRFSISWSRIMPQGYGEINEEGVEFYNNLIDGLLAKGIQPWVTLFHWDLPLALQFEKDGLLNPSISDDFVNYARVCFERFGDRVKHWISLNEPWCSAMLGHGLGVKAPGRVSLTEPYIVGHNLLIAHAKTVELYRREFKAEQQGLIGITNNCDWREPASKHTKDIEAAERALEFFIGWFADPVYLGDYPKSMRDRLGERLPSFTAEEKHLLLNSSDFFGLNHYSTLIASNGDGMGHIENTIKGNGGISDDQNVLLSSRDEWAKTDMGWNIVPWGCQSLLEWIHKRYNGPNIYITENGCALDGEDDIDVAIDDQRRINYLRSYIDKCEAAIKNGVKLKGYFAWSLMDNFEWEEGYSRRFGLHYVDYTTGERTAKRSSQWYSEKIIQSKR